MPKPKKLSQVAIVEEELVKLFAIPDNFAKAKRANKLNEIFNIIDMCKEFLSEVRDEVGEKRDNVEERQPDSDLCADLNTEFDSLGTIIDSLDELDKEVWEDA